jgi:hypothetical protein
MRLTTSVRQQRGWSNTAHELEHRDGCTFGARFVYLGTNHVRIIADRSQWFLDVAA